MEDNHIEEAFKNVQDLLQQYKDRVHLLEMEIINELPDAEEIFTMLKLKRGNRR